MLGGQKARVFAVTGLLRGEKGMECMPLLLLLLQSRCRGALHCCGRVMFRRFTETVAKRAPPFPHAVDNNQFKDAETVAEFKARVFGDDIGEGKKVSEKTPAALV